MILTDELIRDFLQYLYDNGYRYLFVVTYNDVVAISKSKPTFSNEKCLESMAFYDKLYGYEYKLGKAILNDTYYCIDIGKKLNIIDWSAVEVDTKIRVRDSQDSVWKKRHFACYANGEVYAYDSGRTSWSNMSNEFSKLVPWKFAEVVEE